MGKKEDLAAQIAAMQAELDAAESGEADYEVEVRSGDKSARIPASQAKSWLKEHFGIGAEEAPPEGGDGKTDPPADPPPASGIWGRK